MITWNSTWQDLVDAVNASRDFVIVGERNQTFSSNQYLAFGNWWDNPALWPALPFASILKAVTVTSQTNATANTNFRILKNWVAYGDTITIPSWQNKAVLNNLNLSFAQGDKINMQCTGGSWWTWWNWLFLFQYTL